MKSRGSYKKQHAPYVVKLKTIRVGGEPFVSYGKKYCLGYSSSRALYRDRTNEKPGQAPDA